MKDFFNCRNSCEDHGREEHKRCICVERGPMGPAGRDGKDGRDGQHGRTPDLCDLAEQLECLCRERGRRGHHEHKNECGKPC